MRSSRGVFADSIGDLSPNPNLSGFEKDMSIVFHLSKIGFQGIIPWCQLHKLPALRAHLTFDADSR